MHLERAAQALPISTRRGIGSRAVRALAHPLTLLLLSFCVNTLLWAATIAPNRAPDEIAHVEYIRHLALRGTLPSLGHTTYTSNPAVPNPQAQQPPLYYLLATPVQIALAGHPDWQDLGLRAFSAALGAATVALTYALGRALAPGRTAFALALAALVGFNPAFTAISAAVNNDNLINLIFVALLLLCWRAIEQRRLGGRGLLGLGLLLGAGALTKFSITVALPIVGALLVWLARQRPVGRLRWLLLALGVVGGTALLVCGWLLARNMALYGDPTALAAFVRFPKIYPAHGYGEQGTLWEMLTTGRKGFIFFWHGVLYGFWGIFDMYLLWMPRHVYRILCGLLGGSLLGALWWAFQRLRRRDSPAVRQQLAFAALAGALALLMLGSIIARSYQSDYQPQGRYMLPALVPLCLMLLIGLPALLPPALRRFAAPLLVALIVAANVVARVVVIAPAYRDFTTRQDLHAPQSKPQTIFGSLAAQLSFVAEQPRIEALELLVAPVKNVRTPLVARLYADNGVKEVAAVADSAPPRVELLRYRIDVRGLTFVPGQRYRLALQAPWTTDDKPLSVYAGLGMSTGDDLRVIYPAGLSRPTALRIDEMLRLNAPETLRGTVQRIFGLLSPLLLVAVVLTLFALTLGPRYGLPAGIIALGLFIAALTGPPMITPPDMLITNRVLVAGTQPLLRLDRDDPQVAADLLLLSGGAAAQKLPPDDQLQRRSAIQPYRFAIDGDARPVLSVPPPGVITYTLTLPEHAWLRTGLALNPQVWQPDKGDGVEFVVRLVAAGESHELLRRALDPKHEPRDRRWNDVLIDLRGYGGQQVHLALATLPGPADDSRYDWAAWAAPAIVVCETAPCALSGAP